MYKTIVGSDGECARINVEIPDARANSQDRQTITIINTIRKLCATNESKWASS